MYLRYTTVRKDGKTHKYWRLVQSVRIGRRVIQQTVAQLGELDREGKIAARGLAREIVGNPEQAELFQDKNLPEVAHVRIKGVRVERSLQFGDVYLALALWRGLQLEEFCAGVLPEGREEVPWEKMAAILVCARLCEPSSELHIAEDWFRRTALGDLLQVDPKVVNKDRLYRALDQLLPHKEALEAHLVRRTGELFRRENDVLLYDVTSTYFEGQAKANPKAQRGYSRDHRPDCKQVCIALVVTFDGFPLGYEVFAGNTADVKTLQTIVEVMEKRHGTIGRVWVMDRGMVSQTNLEWLRSTGRKYLIATPKSELKKWAPHIIDKTDWREIREGVEVKLCRGPQGDEMFLLCRSRDRMEKEKAMHQRFSERIQKGLDALSGRITRSKKRLSKDVVNRQIGRLLQRNSRSAARFKIQVVDDSSRAGFHLDVSIDPQFDEWALHSEGTYVLRTNVSDWNDERLWKTYIQLTQAEAAFRIQKDPLSIRPIWHQKEERVEAHILVCFLAFTLWKMLEAWQSRAGLGNSPTTILEEMTRIQSHDVILPTTEGIHLRLRCVAQPDSAQSVLLERLGLLLPKRLRFPEIAAANLSLH